MPRPFESKRPHLGKCRSFALGIGLVSLITAGAYGTQAVASASTKTTTTTLSLWIPGQDPSVTAAVNGFNGSQTSVKVAINIVPGTTYDTKLDLALTSGHVPDVFVTYGGGNTFENFLPGHYLLNLSTYLPAIKKDYLASVLAPISSQGQVFAVPFTGVQPNEFYYNKKDFAIAGIKQVPTTWAALLSDIALIKAHHIIPIAQGSENWCEMMWTMNIATKLGGAAAWNAIIAKKPHAWSNPAIIKANTLVEDLLAVKPFEAGFQGIQWGNGIPSEMVASGIAAMELQGSWEYGNLEGKAPSFITSNQLGYFAFPTVPGATADAADVAGNPATYFAIASKSPNQKAALSFFQYLLSAKYRSIVLAGGQVPGMATGGQAIAAAHLTPVLRSWDEFLFKIVKAAPYFQQSWDQALTPAVSTEMVNDVSKLFAGKMTPTQFSADLDAFDAHGAA